MVNKKRMAEQLELHEGVQLRVYQDTLGNDTLGIGYNVAARTLAEFEKTVKHPIDRTADPCITLAEARKQLAVDIVRVEKAVTFSYPGYETLNEVRQRVMIDLAFNLGLGLLTFKNFLAAVKARDWSKAAKELFKSKWAYQVDDGPGRHFGRADRLAKMILTGEDYAS